MSKGTGVTTPGWIRRIVNRGISAGLIDVGGDGLPAGGTTGQILVKQSADDGDADWQAQSGGSAYTQVANYAALPAAGDHTGEIYVVQATTGFLWSRRAGFYRSTGSAWNRLSNATFQVLDDEMTISDNADTSKKLQFQLSNQTTGQTRILTSADRNYDLDIPEVTYVNLIDGLSDPAHTEGFLFYDDAKKCPAFYNDKSTVKHQIGRELWARACNNSGSTIANGSVVYISGVDTGCPEVDLAQPDEYTKSRIIGVLTEALINGGDGEVTSYGLVNDIDTSGLSEGPVYLSTDGSITSTKPTGSNYVVVVGICLTVHATTGSIFVSTVVTDTTVEVTDTNGFPAQWRTGSTMSFVDGTRTFTIAPVGDHFHYYIDGDSYHVGSSDSLVIADTEGLHLIYYLGDTLTDIVNPTDTQVDTIIRTECLVTILYWDATNNTAIYFADERHGISMSPSTHTYLHFSRGAQYLSGLGIGDLITTGDGDTNSHAQFSVAAGIIADEDLVIESSTINSTTGLPIFYLDGASGNMRRAVQAGYSVLTDTTAGLGSPTGNLVWNEYTGGAWQLTSVPNGDFVLCHVFAINGLEGQDQQVAMIGQAVYGNAGQARIGAATEIVNIISGYPHPEIVPVATIIFQTRTTYGNAVNARVRPGDDVDYVDWRVTELAQGTPATAHANTTGLENNDHPQYLLEALYDANTILKADTDDTPAALTVAEQTLVGRITAGVITALTAAQVRTLINVEDAADVTDATNVNSAGAVMEADYNANTVLAATSDDTPAALTVAEQTLVGRITSGSIDALTIAEIIAMLFHTGTTAPTDTTRFWIDTNTP